jgi:hypothetical protein
VLSVTAQGWFSAASARITAVISMRLLVVSFSAPTSSFSWPHAQEGGPAAGAGVALAGAVGEDLDLFHAKTPAWAGSA